MLDHLAAQPIHPPVTAVGKLMVRAGVGANGITLACVFSGLCAITIATRIFWGWRAFQ
jgi:hypothetical protein